MNEILLAFTDGESSCKKRPEIIFKIKFPVSVSGTTGRCPNGYQSAGQCVNGRCTTPGYTCVAGNICCYQGTQTIGTITGTYHPAYNRQNHVLSLPYSGILLDSSDLAAGCMYCGIRICFYFCRDSAMPKWVSKCWPMCRWSMFNTWLYLCSREYLLLPFNSDKLGHLYW